MNSDNQVPSLTPGNSGHVEPCPVAGCNLPIDIILVSADGIAISTHKANLGHFSNGFPPYAVPGGPDALMDEGLGTPERVKLEEKGNVLRLLLQYMHHAHLPELDEVDFDIFVQLAEAAEKYEVFSLIAFCKTIMKQRSERPVDRKLKAEAILVLFYALKHGYTSIADQVALNTLYWPVNEFLTQAYAAGVQAQHIIQWIRYREVYVTQAQDLLGWCQFTSVRFDKHMDGDSLCLQWFNFEREVISKLWAGPGSMVINFRQTLIKETTIDEADEDYEPDFDYFKMTCRRCIERRDYWADYAEQVVVRKVQFSNLPV